MFIIPSLCLCALEYLSLVERITNFMVFLSCLTAGTLGAPFGRFPSSIKVFNIAIFYSGGDSRPAAARGLNLFNSHEILVGVHIHTLTGYKNYWSLQYNIENWSY